MTTTTDVTTTRPLQEVVSDPDAAGAVAVPEYDRAELRAGVVHFGVGGFHRAHQALYLDELARRGETEWGVIGVGMHRSEMKEVLAAQDNLFTVVERGPEGERARIVGSIIDYLYAPEQSDAVLAALTDPRIRLVTLTLTGAGYPVDPASGEFHPEDDDEVAADLSSAGEPSSVFGFLVEALRLRREAGVAPFTVMSCDNAAENGRAARAAVCGFARERDDELADWIERYVAFPSSMVDRITPATSPRDREEIVERLGVDDGWPVITEPFSQWIIEDRFCNDRPPLDAVGVQFVADVRPYELMKTRLLNGSHCALGYFGLLLGHERGDEAMGDPELGEYIVGMMNQVIPLLPPVEGIDLQQYRDVLVSRLLNPEIGDRLDRLARRGSVKLGSYVAPSIVDARRRGEDCRLLTGTVAAWIALLGREVDGNAAVQDPQLDELAPIAAKGDVRGILAAVRGLALLTEDDEVCREIERVVAALLEHGARSILRAALEER
jgi:fructuronate reductase/mannitol 2-dehydrogenase